MSDHEPPHRVQRYPLPDSEPVIAIARARRLAWVDAVHAVSNSRLTEHEREARDDELPVDNDKDGA